MNFNCIRTSCVQYNNVCLSKQSVFEDINLKMSAHKKLIIHYNMLAQKSIASFPRKQFTCSHCISQQQATVSPVYRIYDFTNVAPCRVLNAIYRLCLLTQWITERPLKIQERGESTDLFLCIGFSLLLLFMVFLW